MSDKNQDDAMLREKDLRSFGEKLKSTRENMGLSVQEAASRLHLSPRFISMLENENLLESTLPLIYLRGYLRSYTRVLNIPEAELAWALEKLDPQPCVEPEPVVPAATESMTASFSLESNPYYSRIATVIISLALLTCITTWWYHHGSNEAPTVVALEQTQAVPEAAAQLTPAAASPTPLSANNNPLLQTASKGPEPEPAKAPAAAVDLAAKKPVALASAATESSAHPLTTAKPATKHDDNDDDGVDEQE